MPSSAARAIVGLGLVVALSGAVLAGCASSGGDGADGGGGTTATAAGPEPEALPDGADLYDPPAALAAGPAGSLAWYEELPSLGRARAWRTLTRSTGGDGEPTWVTGMVFRPGTDAPEGGFPVVVWAHGTSGVADACAPSRAGAQVPSLQRLLGAGFVVVAPDGAGLGPPGPAQYLVGVSEGHALLDAARSTADLPGADAGPATGFWGYSSGGQAALFAAQEAPEYAPALDVLGTVAVAPVSDVARFAGRASTLPLTFGYSFLTFGAWTDVYDDADPATIFTPSVVAELPLLQQECAPTIAPHFALTPIDQLRVADPETTAPWPALMADNSVDEAPVGGPLLLVQGTEDPIIAPESTTALAERQCAAGATVELRPVPGRHDVVLAQGDAVALWFTERSAGVPATSSCTP